MERYRDCGGGFYTAFVFWGRGKIEVFKFRMFG